jgi:hypothetical protein
MLSLQAVSPELVLQVNERPQFRRSVAPMGRRALRRRLSMVAARLERSVDYQSSLQRVLSAGEQFQRSLDEAQRSSWLALEDALHDHAWRSNRAFFRAGVEMGQELASTRARVPPRRTKSRPNPSRGANRSADDRAVILTLLDIIRRFTER